MKKTAEEHAYSIIYALCVKAGENKVDKQQANELIDQIVKLIGCLPQAQQTELSDEDIETLFYEDRMRSYFSTVSDEKAAITFGELIRDKIKNTK